MTIDNRFPWMCRLAHAPGSGPFALSPQERSWAERFADEVCRRTFTSCVYNARTGGLFFYRGNMDRGVYEFPFKPADECAERLTGRDLDDCVSLINSSRLSREQKDRIAAANEKSIASDRESFIDRQLDDVRPEAERYAVHLDQRRRGVQRVSAVV